jgi:hypothetical protein
VKRYVFGAYWALHLTFCALWASYPALRKSTSGVRRAAAVYGNYTGAANGYGFFSPAIPYAYRIRVRALVLDRWVPISAPLSGIESRNRLATIMGLLMDRDRSEIVAASWAAYAFGCVPSADAVVAYVEVYEVPPMDEYRRGARPTWLLLHVYPFVRAGARHG